METPGHNSMAKLIIPPSDIRVIIEKTAGFVAKNGASFEEKIHENERHNPKFAFMSPNDPYNMYYRKRLLELIDAGSDAISKAISDSISSEAAASSQMDLSKNQNDGQVSNIEGEKDKQFNVPIENLDFLLELPTILPVDLDILKLTAQFAAKNGKQFILHLSQKESRNSQFDFLKPHHSLHPFYQSLVRQYSLILSPSDSFTERIKRCAFNDYEHIQSVKKRAQLEKLERKRLSEQEAIEKREQEAFAKVDWHNFMVAETVTFGPEDQLKDLPGPMSREYFMSLSITDKLEMWTGRKIELNPLSLNMENDSDRVVQESLNEESITQIEEEDEIETEFSSSQTKEIILPAKRSNEVIMGAAFDGVPIKVRTDYVPGGSRAKSSKPAEPTQLCSICKSAVPVSQIDEHIRIELLDPKWRTQRLAMLAKNRDSNLLETGTEVSRNLGQLARNRSDIFVSSATNSSTSSDTIERGPTRPIWDGRADSIGQINRAAQIIAKPQIEQDMVALQRSGDFYLDPSRGIGPRMPVPQIPAQMLPPQMFMPPPPFYPGHPPVGLPPQFGLPQQPPFPMFSQSMVPPAPQPFDPSSLALQQHQQQQQNK